MPVEIKIIDPVNQVQRVSPDQDVIMSITIGNAQIGGSFIQDSGGNPIAKGSITNLNLGNGANLIGKTITVFTNILDVNPHDNGVVALHHMTNINNDFLYSEIAPEGGVVSFTINYTFQ